MSDKRISVRLDDATRRRLKRFVLATGKSESDVVREALADYFDRRGEVDSCLDLARRHGLIGRARGLPPDLSTNPDHMKGFGR